VCMCTCVCEMCERVARARARVYVRSVLCVSRVRPWLLEGVPMCALICLCVCCVCRCDHGGIMGGMLTSCYPIQMCPLGTVGRQTARTHICTRTHIHTHLSHATIHLYTHYTRYLHRPPRTSRTRVRTLPHRVVTRTHSHAHARTLMYTHTHTHAHRAQGHMVYGPMYEELIVEKLRRVLEQVFIRSHSHARRRHAQNTDADADGLAQTHRRPDTNTHRHGHIDTNYYSYVYCY